MTTKNILLGVGVVIVVVAIWGGYNYPSVTEYSTTHEVTNNVGAPTGSTFISAKVAEVVMAPISASATSSSILNSDASDRIITDAFVSCFPAAGSVQMQTNAGVANWQWIAATTSANAPATMSVTNLAMGVNVSTSSTADAFAATSTYTNVIARRWMAGSYLTFMTNATSSTTGLECVPGVHYIAS